MLKALLRSIITPRPGVRSERDPGPPLLPLPPPCLSSSTDAQPRSQQIQSPLFSLPAELREHILRLAFGDREIHVGVWSRDGLDLHRWECAHALADVMARAYATAEPPAWGWHRLVPWLGPPPTGSSDPAEDDETNRSGWKWTGCVCYANVPGRWFRDPRPYRVWPYFKDGCRGKDDEPDLFSEQKQVGVMGFLLSCKRGYEEGLHILYSRNVFLFEDGALLRKLVAQNTVPEAPHYIGPGLQLITSLAIRSTLELWQPGLSTEETDSASRSRFAQTLDSIVQAFPALSHLRVAVYGTLVYHRPRDPPEPEWYLGRIEEAILGPMQRASGQMTAMNNKRVVLSVELPLFRSVQRIAERHGSAPWRALPWDKSPELWKSTLWYPFTEQPEDSAAGGFWIMPERISEEKAVRLMQ